MSRLHSKMLMEAMRGHAKGSADFKHQQKVLTKTRKLGWHEALVEDEAEREKTFWQDFACRILAWDCICAGLMLGFFISLWGQVKADRDVTFLNWLAYLSVAPTSLAVLLVATCARGYYVTHRLPFVMAVRLACVLGIVPLPFLSDHMITATTWKSFTVQFLVNCTGVRSLLFCPFLWPAGSHVHLLFAAILMEIRVWGNESACDFMHQPHVGFFPWMDRVQLAADHVVGVCKGKGGNEWLCENVVAAPLKAALAFKTPIGCQWGRSTSQVTVSLLLLLVSHWVEAVARRRYIKRTGKTLRPQDLPILLVVQLSHVYMLLVCWSTYTHPWIM